MISEIESKFRFLVNFVVVVFSIDEKDANIPCPSIINTNEIAY